MPYRFAIAGFPFELACEADCLASLDQDWREFRSTEIPQTHIRLELLPAVNHSMDQQMPLPTVTRGAEGGLAISGEGFEARVSADRRFAQVFSPPERFPLEAVVRILLADLLLARDGLLLHSVGIEVDRCAAVFVGASGAGKSTLGGLCRDAGLRCLSDELVAVAPVASGYLAYGTPWNIGRCARAELRMLGVLEHAAHAVVEELPAAELLRALLPNALMPDPSAETRARMFRGACTLVSSANAVRLRFGREPGVAATLANELRSSSPAHSNAA